MNLSKFATAGLLALSIVGTAAAQQVIYIAGSNGDRTISNTAIPKLLTGTLTFRGTNTDPLKANFGIWTGGSFNGTPVTIKVAYIGATGGIAALAGNQTVKFLPNSASVGVNNPDPTVGANPFDAHVPTLALSTNFQSSSPFEGTYNGVDYATLIGEKVAVIPVRWVGSAGYPGDNITTKQAQSLYTTGALPLAVFTGSSADRNKTVFAVGRNVDAGMRYIALTEIGLGLYAPVQHFQALNITGTTTVGGNAVNGVVGSQQLWPAETFSGISQGIGGGGYATGSALAIVLTHTLSANAYKVYNPNATAGYYIGYITQGDWATITSPYGKALKWNGVEYSAAAVQEGQYTFWVYEWVFRKDSTSALGNSFADALQNQIKTVDATVGGLFLNENFVVSRLAEGGAVSPDYF